jgi:hypothetical protein
VALLRRTLYLDALLTGLGSVVLVAIPGVMLRALGQPELVDVVWLRLLGVAGFVLALVMVLIGNRLEELWWWSWAFVALEGGAAAVKTLHAAFGLPSGAAAWPWWIWALASWGFAFAFLWGLARAGVEKPPA